MKFTTNFKSVKLDFAAYKDALDAYLTKKLKEGGRKWLDATVRTPTHIPTWSGASRSTFQKLAAELGTTIPIGPIRARRDKTMEGFAAGARSGVIIEPNKGKWQFQYITNLPHLVFNESNGPTPGPYPAPWSRRVRFTPYGFQAKGAEAWLRFAARTKLPNPYKYLKIGAF